jgi:hypothetical protein
MKQQVPKNTPSPTLSEREIQLREENLKRYFQPNSIGDTRANQDDFDYLKPEPTDFAVLADGTFIPSMNMVMDMKAARHKVPASVLDEFGVRWVRQQSIKFFWSKIINHIINDNREVNKKRPIKYVEPYT